MLDGAVGAAPAKSRAGKGFPKPYFNAEILRLRKERVRVLVEIKVLERDGGDTSDLWAEFRALRAKAIKKKIPPCSIGGAGCPAGPKGPWPQGPKRPG